MRIVETDDYGGDYPNEQFLNFPPLLQKSAERIAEAINESFPKDSARYWKVVEDDYILQSGFEP